MEVASDGAVAIVFHLFLRRRLYLFLAIYHSGRRHHIITSATATHHAPNAPPPLFPQTVYHFLANHECNPLQVMDKLRSYADDLNSASSGALEALPTQGPCSK